MNICITDYFLQMTFLNSQYLKICILVKTRIMGLNILLYYFLLPMLHLGVTKIKLYIFLKLIKIFVAVRIIWNIQGRLRWWVCWTAKKVCSFYVSSSSGIIWRNEMRYVQIFISYSTNRHLYLSVWNVTTAWAIAAANRVLRNTALAFLISAFTHK